MLQKIVKNWIQWVKTVVCLAQAAEIWTKVSREGESSIRKTNRSIKLKLFTKAFPSNTWGETRLKHLLIRETNEPRMKEQRCEDEAPETLEEHLLFSSYESWDGRRRRITGQKMLHSFPREIQPLGRQRLGRVHVSEVASTRATFVCPDALERSTAK